MTEMTEKDEELWAIIKIIETKPEGILDKCVRLHQYFNSDFDWTAYSIKPDYLIIPDVNFEQIHIYQRQPAQNCDGGSYKKIYCCNLRLHSINGDGIYYHKQKLGLIK